MKPDMNSFLVMAGHGLFKDGRWTGVRDPRDIPAVEQHIIDAVRICRTAGYGVLFMSGSRTRPSDPKCLTGGVTNSEAEGMMEFLRNRNVDTDGLLILVEPLARTTLENLTWCLLAYRAALGRWPTGRIGFLTWKFKSLRVYLNSLGLGLGNRFEFFGSGEPADPENARFELLHVARMLGDDRSELVDPLERGPQFEALRQSRTHPDYQGRFYEAVLDVYVGADQSESAREACQFVNDLRSLEPGLGWRELIKPW